MSMREKVEGERKGARAVSIMHDRHHIELGTRTFI